MTTPTHSQAVEAAALLTAANYINGEGDGYLDDGATDHITKVLRKIAAELTSPQVTPSNSDAADARREIGKWLNEGTGKPIDREALAQLCVAFDALTRQQEVVGGVDASRVPADEAAEFVKLVLDDCGFHVWSDDIKTVIGVRPPRETVRHYADFMKAADWLVKYGYAEWDASVQPEHLHIHECRVTTTQAQPPGREAGMSDHLAACDGGGVTQPLTDAQILDEASHHGFIGSRPQLIEFTRAIEAAHGINPGSAPREAGHEPARVHGEIGCEACQIDLPMFAELVAAAEREECAKDAERYRWLATRFLGADFDWNETGTCALVFEWPLDVLVGANCDRNIDAAILASASPAGEGDKA